MGMYDRILVILNISWIWIPTKKIEEERIPISTFIYTGIDIIVLFKGGGVFYHRHLHDIFFLSVYTNHLKFCPGKMQKQNAFWLENLTKLFGEI